jgi:hypothetical protein
VPLFESSCDRLSDVIIPAFNEQNSVGKVNCINIDKKLVREIIVVNNNSNDETASGWQGKRWSIQVTDVKPGKVMATPA